MSKILIVADDLTGANANGSLLAGKGFSAATCLDLNQWDADYFNEFDAVTLNTDSRLLPQAMAGRKVYEGFSLLLKSASTPQVLSKRIDSTLRGNVGAEIEAALRATDKRKLSAEPAIAVVVPAFPASLRYAVGGYLVVNGMPLEKSPIAKDPILPITTSRFVDIVSQQTDLPVGYVPLDAAMQGAPAVRAAIDALVKQGKRIITCDAVTDDDISVIAEALKDVSFPVVAVDPGPFTAAMADARIPKKVRHELDDHILVVVGSITELIRRQMEALRLARKCAVVKADPRLLVSPDTREKAVEDVVNRVIAKVGTAEVYGVCTVERPEDVVSLDELAVELGLSNHEVSGRINTGLAEIGEALLRRAELNIGGIYTSGGEVTVAMARQLGVSGIAVRDEVLPLAVYGRLIGGKHPNFPVITKGGFVGNEQAIVECINYLFTKISTSKKDKKNED